MDSNHQSSWYGCIQGESSRQSPQTNSVTETDDSHLERNLRETQQELEKYRTLYESLPTIYLTLDAAGIILGVNQFGAAHLGYTVQELIGQSLFSLVYPEDKGKLQVELVTFVQNQSQNLLDSDFPAYLDTCLANAEFRLISKQGSILWVKMTARAGEKSHFNREILAVCEDITERKQREAALEKSEELFRGLFENSLDAIVIADDNGHYICVNQAACQLLGYSQEQLLQMNVSDLVTTETQSAAERYQAYGKLGREFGEFSFIRADGAPRIAEYAACRFASNLNLSILRDITDRKRAEQALLDDANRLYAINASLHDIVTADLDLNQIMNLIVERTQHLTHATGAALEIIEGDEMVYRAASGAALPHIGVRLKINSSLSGLCVQRREILCCDDVETDPRVDLAACRQVGVRSMVVVPLYHGRTVIGVLKVLSSKTQAFGYAEIYTLQLMTRLLAAAMSHASEFAAKQAALEALQESEERFRRLIQDLQVGVMLRGPNTEILLCNQATLDLLGMTESQLLGKTSFDPDWQLIGEHGLPFPREALPVPQAIATRQPVRNVVFGVYRPAFDNFIWLLVHAEPQFAPDGSVKQVICTFSDISERKAAEEALQKVNEQLEIRVEERTAALKAANQELRNKILEHKQTESALQQSEAKNRALISALPDLILRIGKDGTYLDCKAARDFQTLLPPEEFIGKHFSEVLPPEIVQLSKYYKERAFATGEMQVFEYQLPYQGTLRDYEARIVVSKDDELLAVIRDITQRKQAEAALQQQTERERLVNAIAQRIRQSLDLEEILNTTAAQVRQFLQTDRVIIFRFQPDWSGIVVVESVTNTWTSILGTQISDPCFEERYVQLYKHGRTKAIEDIYTAGLHQCHLDMLAQMQVRADLIVPILQGETLWGLLIAHHCAAPRQWQQQEIDLLCSLATQVAIAIQQSELYQQVQQLNTDLERQVQERTAQLQQALDFEALLKRVTDKVRDSLDESQILQTAVQELALGLKVSCCDTTLYDLEQGTATIRYAYTVSMPVAQEREDQMAVFTEFHHQLIQEQYMQFCKSYPPQDWITALACPIFDDQGILGDLWLFKPKENVFSELEIRLVQQVANQCAIAIRQARLYQAEQAQIKELEKLNHLKDDFLNTVSHELRTPISNMKMAIQMLEITLKREGLLDVATPSSKTEVSKLTRYLQILQNECKRETELINDLLDLQRLEAGTRLIDLDVIELQLWLPQVVKPFQDRAQNRQQILQIHLSPELPSLLSDASSLERILAELLNNACKYTPPGETISVTADIKSGILQLNVRNWGAEIPANELSRIFEKFYRIPNSDPWKQGGTGLGLALIKRLTEHLGGSIRVESGAGQTCFTIHLPINGGR